MSGRAEAVGGPILTKATRWILWVGIIGAILILWRFAVGLGR